MDDIDRKPKKSRKRISGIGKDETTTEKKARINGIVEEGPDLVYSSETTRNEERDTLDGEGLRAVLSSPHGLDALRKFVRICKEKNVERDLAAEYLLAGGGVFEVLRPLDFSDKKSIVNAIPVFSAIHILLMKILAEYPQYQNSAVEACRHLLNSYMSVIHSMIITQSIKQRKVVLKILTAIASLDNSLARELLARLTLQRNVLEDLVQHVKPTDPRNVRTCYIHFILAFLVEGDSSVIKMLLDKRNLLSCIFSDLLYDNKDIVTLILSTLKTYVLENVSINKTLKMHVFSTSVVLNLISLYNWKGPAKWPKNKTHHSIEDENFLADKEIVTDAIHAFLITLLTSYRYGIIFHDQTLGSSRDKHNQLVQMVLQSLEKPWEHEKPLDLVIKILEACPDLIRSQYNVVEPFLEPRVSPKWICVLKFIKKFQI